MSPGIAGSESKDFVWKSLRFFFRHEACLRHRGHSLSVEVKSQFVSPGKSDMIRPSLFLTAGRRRVLTACLKQASGNLLRR